MSNKALYIEQSAVENSLYTQLQEATLKEAQRLSGKNWTNFNANDPGVTIGDIANYVLAELDYKLGFELIDLLTFENEDFKPENYGMFLPEEVYPTTPVTVNDYRKFLFLHCPGLDNVKIETSKNGEYEIKAILSPFGDENTTLNQIEACFNASRNLCEKLEKVEKFDPTVLYLHSELEIEQGENANVVLARIYWEILLYLSGNVHLEDTENLLKNKISWEEWFEGPTGRTRVIIPEQQNIMTELYDRLTRLKGVKTFKICYLTLDKENVNRIISNFTQGYSLFIPKEANDIKVKIKIGELDANIDIQCLKKELEALYALNRTCRVKVQEDNSELFYKYLPKGIYRSVFEHRNIGKDFPGCYKADTEYPLDKVTYQTKNKQFSAYLRMYDLIVRRGLTELKAMKELLSIKLVGDVSPKVEVLSPEQQPGLKESERYRNIYQVRSQYLDFLDHLYGVDSRLEWYDELYNVYENREKAILMRRMNFLTHVPNLTKARSKAYNIYSSDSNENISTIELYLSLLLDYMPYPYESALADTTDSHFILGNVKVLEHHLFNPSEQRISVVFDVSHIKNLSECIAIISGIEQLVVSLVPAHINVSIYWQGSAGYGLFKNALSTWNNLLYSHAGADKLKEAQEKLLEYLI